MIPNKADKDESETKIDVQNEIEATETKNDSEKINSVTTLDIDNTAKQEEINNENLIKEQFLNIHTAKAYDYIIQRKPPEYWVQFNLAAGSRIPDGGGPPLYYEPDRNLFVRIVFAIVLFMLLLTAGFVAFVYFTDARKMILRLGIIVLIIGMGGMLSLNYAMMCSACTRVPPCNFVCLFLAVVFMSLITAYMTAIYKTQTVLFALLATTITVAVCLCLAFTSFDFTKFMLYFIVIACAFSALTLIVGITMWVTETRYKPVTLVILAVGTILNIVFLIMELQMILGGRAVELSEDDYALGAFMLYTSIIDIFLKMLHLIGILGEEF